MGHALDHEVANACSPSYVFAYSSDVASLNLKPREASEISNWRSEQDRSRVPGAHVHDDARNRCGGGTPVAHAGPAQNLTDESRNATASRWKTPKKRNNLPWLRSTLPAPNLGNPTKIHLSPVARWRDITSRLAVTVQINFPLFDNPLAITKSILEAASEWMLRCDDSAMRKEASVKVGKYGKYKYSADW